MSPKTSKAQDSKFAQHLAATRPNPGHPHRVQTILNKLDTETSELILQACALHDVYSAKWIGDAITAHIADLDEPWTQFETRPVSAGAVRNFRAAYFPKPADGAHG